MFKTGMVNALHCFNKTKLYDYKTVETYRLTSIYCYFLKVVTKVLNWLGAFIVIIFQLTVANVSIQLSVRKDGLTLGGISHSIEYAY